ncbi:MAG: HYR domain-containing protein [Lewinellaceae bacterium]|nr:HYR domain-containing protein [Lewinellaceae bacterium]
MRTAKRKSRTLPVRSARTTATTPRSHKCPPRVQSITVGTTTVTVTATDNSGNTATCTTTVTVEDTTAPTFTCSGQRNRCGQRQLHGFGPESGCFGKQRIGQLHGQPDGHAKYSSRHADQQRCAGDHHGHGRCRQQRDMRCVGQSYRQHTAERGLPKHHAATGPHRLGIYQRR